MNLLNRDNVKNKIAVKIFIIFLFLLLIPIFISYIFIRQAVFKRTDTSLVATVARVKQDLVYKNGKWDVALYNSDPDTPSPNSTNSFPLYVITTDGFVIDRSKPIEGLLDSADFERFLAYKSLQTIHTPTNEVWRIISKPIQDSSNVIGVITVAYYAPRQNSYDQIDDELTNSLDNIYSKVKVTRGQIDISSFDARAPYDISYSIVNKFNKVIITNGRMPSFMDVSYVAPELTAGERTVTDKKTGEKFLVLSKSLVDSKGLPVGVVVAGRSISSLLLILNNYIIFSLLIALFFSIPVTIFLAYMLRRDFMALLSTDKRKSFKKIAFNIRDSVIVVDNVLTKIPYSSNQYYLCKAIFSNPKKMWETDELLDKLGDGEITGNTRKIYDAMLAINRKVGIKLIINKDKVYRFNPIFLQMLKP